MRGKKKPFKVAAPRVRKGHPTVRVDKSDYEALVLRSRTLAAIGKGSGLPCTRCNACLMVGDKCPGCGKEIIVSEA